MYILNKVNNNFVQNYQYEINVKKNYPLQTNAIDKDGKTL